MVNRAQQKYEIPAHMQERHEVQFYNKSLNLEDNLNNLQLVLLVDHSGSMQETDEDATGQGRSNGMVESGIWTRYDNVFQAAKYLADSIFEYDTNSQVPLIFFNNNISEIIADSVGTMLVQFKKHLPKGSTNMLGALELAFKKHLNDSENILFIVFTDGTPDQGQEDKIKKLIQNNVTKSDPTGNRVNILFIRHGDDQDAIDFLEYLDNCEEIGENVDTKSDNAVYAMGPKNLILNAIHEHLDSQYAHIR